MSTIPPGKENLSLSVSLLLQHVRNQLSSPGTNSCLADSKPFMTLWQVSATTALVCLLLVISQKPRSSGRLILTKSKALELITRWSRKELLEDEDRLRRGSLLCPGALRLCSEIIHGKEQVPLEKKFCSWVSSVLCQDGGDPWHAPSRMSFLQLPPKKKA